MTQLATQLATDTKIATPPPLSEITLSRNHATVLVDILKRTARASTIENEWILHTIDTLTEQLARQR